MIKRQLLVFLLRWLISSASMWICINYFGKITSGYANDAWLYISAGLIFSLINSIVKPIATAFALPFIILSLGLFTIFVNISMMALTIYLLPNVEMEFWGAVASTLVMSFINGLANFLVPSYNSR